MIDRTLSRFAAFLMFPAYVAGQDRIDPMGATVAQSDAMPAEKYGYRPTDGEFKDVRIFGEHVKHVACTNFAFFNEIEK